MTKRETASIVEIIDNSYVYDDGVYFYVAVRGERIKSTVSGLYISDKPVFTKKQFIDILHKQATRYI